jgi:hypothetical protein
VRNPLGGGALAVLFLAHTGPVAGWQEPPRPGASVGEDVRRERELLAGYRFRMKTEMRVEGQLRLTRLEDVNFGPEGGLQKKLVRFERAPEPTPVPYGDPRARIETVFSPDSDDRFFDAARSLMELYARLTPEQVNAWAAKAKLLPPDPDRPGLLRMQGRGLGRPQDDAVVFLDPKSLRATEVEVKTTVDPEVKEIAFIRASFEVLTAAISGAPSVLVPKRIFLNMTRGHRAVTLEMETSDWRQWR